MAEVGGSSGGQLFQVPGSEQDKLEQVVQGCVQLDFDCRQGWRVHKLSGQPVQCSTTFTLKKSFSLICMEFSAFQFVPLAFCPVTGYAGYLGV